MPFYPSVVLEDPSAIFGVRTGIGVFEVGLPDLPEPSDLKVFR